MSILDKLFRDERLIRKLRVVSEAERVGSRPMRALDEVRESLAFCFANGPNRHFYGERHVHGAGLSGLLVSPGEHHAILPCNAPAPAAFAAEQNAWWSPDPALAWSLQQTEQAIGLGNQSWRWYRRHGGDSYFDVEWCAQIRPCAQGVHLVVRGLQPGLGDDFNLVGTRFFTTVAWAIQTALQGAPTGPEAYEVRPTAFGEIAFDALLDEDSWLPRSEPQDASSVLIPWLASAAGEQVTAEPMAPKRLGLARTVVPPGAAHLPILGVLGDAGVLTKTELLVVTPTHAFVGWENARASFAWTEVTDVGAPEDDLDVCMLRTESLGWIGIPTGRKAKAFTDLLHRIVATFSADDPAEAADPDT